MLETPHLRTCNGRRIAGLIMNDGADDPLLNHLLAALPVDVWQRWKGVLESTDLTLGQVMYEPGTTLSHVYFPTSAIVSLLYVMKNGAPAEIAVVGNEGIVGVSTFIGGNPPRAERSCKAPVTATACDRSS
jgi:hypothetical protein